MKKRNLRLLPLLLLLLAEVSMAENVDRGRARQAATTFLNNNGAQTRGLTDVTSATGFSNVYVFTTENSFILMAADDRVQPILGYSLNGRFDIENMPDNKRAWIEEYTQEIQYAIAHQTRASAEVTQQWRDLVEGRPNAGRATTAVSPLLQTQWDQLSPYNTQCPGGSVTGCVATAMAQIMKYWNYPSHGIGSHSYTHATYGVLSADFQSTTYDWNNMINSYNGSYTNAQKQAVATLMYHCGVSVDMNYSTSASGASTADVAYALKTYFGYSDDVQHLSRSAYSDADWISLLKNELNNSRPIQYHGSGSGGGHSFVFDGYNNSNYFHVNWGWSGFSDEYYSINNLNPGPGGTGSGAYGIYNDNQGAVVGIHPSGSAANAPTNLTYSQNGRTVTLSWSAATGASSYKVYRNNSFIGNASSTSYTDTAPYGSSVYYVRSVDSQGRLSLSSNAVTVNVAYPTPVVDDLAATVSGNNVNLSWTAPDWCYPSTPTATMTYGSGDYYGALGLNGSYALYWGHRYLASNLSSYNNMKVYKVSFYANETGNYKVYIYKGTNTDHPQTQLLQQSFSVGSIGWFDIDLSNPIQIDASKDLWVFIYDPEYRSHPATYSSYSGSDGNYYSTSPASWVNSYDGAAFLIRTFVSDGTYTYNIYRNGTCVANHVNGTSYSDTNLADGTYSYYLKTNYYAGESGSSNQVSATIFNSIPGSGTEQNPYIITTTAQLDALANAVKGGTNFSGTYFVLGNDIAYSTVGLGSTDENFTTIGGYFNGSDKNFSGIFDGQGHTISGIRLCKPLTNQHENKNQALFGRAVGATIKNVTLADASITGYRIVAGIVGHCENSTVQNCLVVNSSITSADTYVGAVIGKDQYGNTFTTNHYMGCTVNGTTNATNVGVGGNGVGTSYSTDYSGVRSVHTLTLGEYITATGESVTYQGTTYYASNTTITLGHEHSGYWATYYVNGAAITGNTFTMPAEDVSVTATWMPDPTHFEMTAIDEYTIHTATGWDLFCDALQDNTFFNHFIGMTVKLDAEISVVRMAGSSGHEFGGTFDGQGHTLTVDYTTTVQITAPFRCVNGATIMNLVTAGTINTSAKFVGGMVGQTMGGTVEITNCVSGVTINSSVNGDGTHGGFLAVASYGTVNFSGCMFSGEMLSECTTLWGGFVGWTESNNNATVTFTDCLFNPTNLTINSGRTFSRARNMSSVTITNCFYTEPLGTPQGLPAISDPNITPYGTPTGSYNVSNLVAYANGLMYGDTFYYDPNFVPPFEQTGTDEYTIHAATGWDFFCDALQDNDTYNRFIGKTVKLAADITVTRMAGSSTHDFMGTFDGQGHTLTLAYGSAESPLTEEYAAPFRYVENGANIHSLHVDGHIYTSNKNAGGIVGCQYGAVSVSNCRSSVVIHSSKEGDGTHGGIVATQRGTFTLSGCVYDGRLLTTNGTTLCSGLVGYHNSGTCTISDCLYAPATDVTLAEGETYINDGATICRNYNGTPVNCYYTETLGTAQGKLAYSITSEDVTLAFAGEATEYDVSGLSTNGVGLAYLSTLNSQLSTLYAGNGDQVSLTFTLTDPEGFSVAAATYTPEGGTATELTLVNGVYSFTMPDADVIINTVTEYLIHNATEWENFCDALQDNDTYNRFIGRTVKLCADISVTRMAGSSTHDFMGIFEGQGHTLTIAYGSAENPITEEYAAPFHNVENGCVIENLHVDGTITTANKFAAGIVAQQYGAVTIRNCRSSVTIQSSVEGDGTHGGLVGVKGNSNNANLTIEGCTFDGKIVSTGTTATTLCGGFVGWRSNSGSLTITNSLYAPTADNNAVSSGATFARNWTMPDDANCYYTETLGTAQGKLAIANPAVLPVGEPTATYDVSNLAFYSNGVLFGEVFYYDPEAMMTQTIALSAGTNWCSFNVETTLADLQAALTDALGTGNNVSITIQSQTDNCTLKRGRWTGNLTTLDVTRMYQIDVSADCEITLGGMPVNPAAHPVTISNGENWIAYPLTMSMTLTDAFAGFAVNDDAVSSQSQNATYKRNRWTGELTTLVPGQGFIYSSSVSQTRTFTFPTAK